MCDGVGQDSCMMNLNKSEQYPLCPNLCFMARAPVCVCVGGGGHFREATRNTLANG